jgi:hypothetical protein
VVLVLLSTSLDPEATGSHAVAMAIALNDDLVGNTTLNNAATLAGAQYGGMFSDNAESLTCQRRVTLNSGDTLRPVGATYGTVAEDLKVNGLVMTVFPQ